MIAITRVVADGIERIKQMDLMFQPFNFSYVNHKCCGLNFFSIKEGKDIIELSFGKRKVIKHRSIWLNNQKCVNCGIQGNLFVLQRDNRSDKFVLPRLRCYHYTGDVNKITLEKFKSTLPYLSKKIYMMGVHRGTMMMTIDHIVPTSHGGTDALTNLQVMCDICNQKKGIIEQIAMKELLCK
jgi:hypothetical protein